MSVPPLAAHESAVDQTHLQQLGFHEVGFGCCHLEQLISDKHDLVHTIADDVDHYRRLLVSRGLMNLNYEIVTVSLESMDGYPKGLQTTIFIIGIVTTIIVGHSYAGKNPCSDTNVIK